MIRSSFNFWSNVACTAQHAATTANTRADEWNDKKGRQGVMITRAGWSRENAILSDQRGGERTMSGPTHNKQQLTKHDRESKTRAQKKENVVERVSVPVGTANKNGNWSAVRQQVPPAQHAATTANNARG